MVWPSSVAFIASTTSSIPPAGDAADEPVDRQILGPHPLERRKPPAEHMESAGKQPRAVERPQVGDLLDDAQQRSSRRGSRHTRTGRLCRHCRRSSRSPSLAADLLPARRAMVRARFALLHQVQHRAARRARTSPGSRASAWVSASISGDAMATRHRRVGAALQAADIGARHADHLHGHPRTSRFRRSMRWSRRGMTSSRFIASRRALRAAARPIARPRSKARAEAGVRGAHSSHRCARRGEQAAFAALDADVAVVAAYGLSCRRRSSMRRGRDASTSMPRCCRAGAVRRRSSARSWPATRLPA